MKEEILEEEVQTASSSRNATGWMKRIIGVLMVLVMAMSVAAPAAVAGPIGRNTVAVAAMPVHAASHAFQVWSIAHYFNPQNTINAYVFGTVPLMLIPGPLQPIALADRTFWTLPMQTDALIGIPLRVVTGAQIAHAAIWNGVDLGILGFITAGNTIAIALSAWTAAAQTALILQGAMVATPIVLTTAALAIPAAGAAALAAPVVAGTAALGAGALGAAALGAAGLGAAALGTTAVVGTGIALGAAGLGAAALGAGALATTAAVGTAAAVGAGIIGYNLLNSTNNETNENEQTDPNASTENTETPAASEEAPTADTVQA